MVRRGRKTTAYGAILLGGLHLLLVGSLSLVVWSQDGSNGKGEIAAWLIILADAPLWIAYHLFPFESILDAAYFLPLYFLVGGTVMWALSGALLGWLFGFLFQIDS